MGYSLDSSSDSAFVKGTELNETVSASAGSHTVHVKAWTGKGLLCTEEVAITVTDKPSAESVPSIAKVNSNLEALTNWKAEHDTGGVGNASGSSKLVTSPSIKGTSRMFSSSFTHNGDMRYSLNFGDDTTSTNFMYDTWVYFNSTSQKIGVLEMDMNQVTAAGKTVIYGFQCDAWDGKWDYAGNTHGTKTPHTGWISTGQPCNPRTWKINTWHHIQISYSRNTAGDVTYHYVTFDGKQVNINKTVFSAYSLGWGKGELITNFQVDGYESTGSNTVYVDQLTISRW